MPIVRTRWWSVPALAVAICAQACTTIPSAEFAGYREAFDQARAAGERVLLDYSIAKQTHARLVEDSAAARSSTSQATPQFNFNARDVSANAREADDIAVRMMAWEVVDRYNSALLRLLDGSSDAQVGAAVDGLIGSLRRFPVRAIAEAAGPVAPFAGIIATAIEAMQKEYEAREFRRAVLAGGDLIPGFVALLIDDAQGYYKVRLLLHDFDYERTLDGVAEDFATVQSLAAEFDLAAAAGSSRGGPQEPSAGSELVKRVNTALAQLRRPDGAAFVELGANSQARPADAIVLAQLRQLASRIDEAVTDADAVDRRLLGYREVMVAYVRLLARLDESSAALTAAARAGEKSLPTAAELADAVIAVRRAFAIYEQQR